MGRKPKYNREIKIETVKQYLNGENSMICLAKNISVNVPTIKEWKNECKINGDFSFQNKPRNKYYYKEFKKFVIQSYLNGEGSLDSISLKYSN